MTLTSNRDFLPCTRAGVPLVGLSKARSLTDLSVGSDFTPNKLSLPQKINRVRGTRLRVSLRSLATPWQANSEGRIYEFRGLCPPSIRTRACAGGIWEPGGVSPRSAMENILEPAQGAGGINGGSDIMR